MDFNYITDFKDERLYNFRKEHLREMLAIIKKLPLLNTLLDGTKGATTEEEVFNLLELNRLHTSTILFSCGYKWGEYWDGYILASFNNIPLFISPYKIIDNILRITFTGIDRMPGSKSSLPTFFWFVRDDGFMSLHEQYAIDNNLDALHFIMSNNFLNKQNQEFLTDIKDLLTEKIDQKRVPDNIKTYVNGLTFGGIWKDRVDENRNLYYYKINLNYTYPN